MHPTFIYTFVFGSMTLWKMAAPLTPTKLLFSVNDCQNWCSLGGDGRKIFCRHADITSEVVGVDN